MATESGIGYTEVYQGKRDQRGKTQPTCTVTRADMGSTTPRRDQQPVNLEEVSHRVLQVASATIEFISELRNLTFTKMLHSEPQATAFFQ